MKKNFAFLIIILIFTLYGCKKPPGEGGSASINGRIWVKDYPAMLEWAGYDEYVYIIYGDEISYGDRIRSTFDGRFEFNFLRKGKYKIYSYSFNPSAPLVDSAVIKEIEITGRKQKIDLGDIVIYK
jgi:hypothetical protein